MAGIDLQVNPTLTDSGLSVNLKNMEPWWGTAQLKEDVWYRAVVYGAAVYLRRSRSQWTAAYTDIRWNKAFAESSPAAEYAAGPPPGAVCSHIRANVPGGEISLGPFFESKAFLVKTALPGALKIFPGAEAAIALELPPSVYIGAELALFSINPFVLKETWYGENTMKGIFAYSLESSLVRDAGIHCPLLLKNKSRTPVVLDHLLFYPELSIYERRAENSRSLCTSTVIIDLFANGEGRLSTRPPGKDPFREKGSKDEYTLLSTDAKTAGDKPIKKGARIITYGR
ncbi:MAG: hypothetical protein LBJ31_00520 [Treponema sp.]|nr:hypothetical protein [Treponema sp.]